MAQAAIRINRVELLPLKQLHPNASNPKRPMHKKQHRGLAESLQEFGFAGALCVAENLDGTFEILDGTTRDEDLTAAGVERLPCAIVDECAGDPTDQTVIDKRLAFRLSYDRNRKLFDEHAVAEQVKGLMDRGRDAAQLAVLTSLDNVKELQAVNKANIDKARQDAEGAKANARLSAAQSIEPKSSLVIYGPQSEIEKIKELTKTIKGRAGISAKVLSALTQADENLDVDDETFLGLFLATLKRWSDAAG